MARKILKISAAAFPLRQIQKNVPILVKWLTKCKEDVYALTRFRLVQESCFLGKAIMVSNISVNGIVIGDIAKSAKN